MDIEQQLIHEKMRQSLHEAIRIVFPLNVTPDELIKPHHWGNPKYLGEVAGKVIWWNGWSANLSNLDHRAKTVYIDFVENTLPESKREELFGEIFAEQIHDTEAYVVMHVGGFPAEMRDQILKDGFVVRTMGRNIHPCHVAPADIFLVGTSLHWAALISRLIIYQQQIGL